MKFSSTKNLESDFFIKNPNITRNVTVCNKCPQRPPFFFFLGGGGGGGRGRGEGKEGG